MNIVIIGNSAAAVGCIEGIRKNNQEVNITVISNEPHHTYSRPLISYLLYGKTDEQRMKYRPDSFYDDNRVRKRTKEVYLYDLKRRKSSVSRIVPGSKRFGGRCRFDRVKMC